MLQQYCDRWIFRTRHQPTLAASEPACRRARGALVDAHQTRPSAAAHLSMDRGGVMLPFTYEQFVDVFATYNTRIWPAQVLAYLVALAILFGLKRRSANLVCAGLALMWLWTGVAYHWMHFASINKAAWLFGALFVLEGALLLLIGATGRIRFGTGAGPLGVVGWGFIAYATVAYPLLGLWTGHGYPRMPTFGVTPCPVTIFTFGVLLLARPVVPKSVLVVPLLWSLVGGSAAFLLQVPQDWVLLFSGAAALPMLLRKDSRTVPAST
ncbi:MAG TPA: DUF6064 family protein [Ramlibacter sp.]|uniref:DUF6064 family protein n=1 Tax=Ramlibacter sp. TaxID=1917967 RepID=UPI002D80C10D|nr:DUF6064 family protein [Ramlibacter sp.]HET8744624.1 DUF6064 family protein [Ramlibacter sp.]